MCERESVCVCVFVCVCVSECVCEREGECVGVGVGVRERDGPAGEGGKARGAEGAPQFPPPEMGVRLISSTEMGVQTSHRAVHLFPRH